MTEDEYRRRWASTIPTEFSGKRGATARNEDGKVTASTSLSFGDFERFKALAISQGRTPSGLLLELVREFLGGTQFLSEIALSEPIQGRRVSLSAPVTVEDHARLAGIASTEWVSMGELLRRLIRDALDGAREPGQ